MAIRAIPVGCISDVGMKKLFGEHNVWLDKRRRVWWIRTEVGKRARKWRQLYVNPL